MLHSCIILFVFSALSAVSFCHAEDLSPSVQLKKDYEKINSLLEKDVLSDNPEVNMAKIEEMLQSDRKIIQVEIFAEKSTIATMEKLSALTRLPSEGDFCKSQDIPIIMKELDSGLEDESRATDREFPLTRVNKIIEHYTVKSMFLCHQYKESQLGYALKQVDYDQINRYLVENLPEVQDAEANMAETEKLLNSLSSRNGALAEALEQFLELRQLLNQATCGQQGFQILFKNDLATRGRAYDWRRTSGRRVDKILRHYGQTHEAVCVPVIRAKFGQLVKSLDAETYRKILAIISSQYLPENQFGQMMVELRRKEVNQEFTLPSVVGQVKRQSKDVNSYPKLKTLIHIDSAKLYRLARVMSANGPDSKYLISQIDEISGKRVVLEDKLEALLDRYFFSPCNHYVGALQELSLLDDYYSSLNGKHLFSWRSNFPRVVADLSYYMVRMAYQVCSSMMASRKKVFDEIKLNARINRY